MNKSGTSIIFFSFIISFILTAIPLPEYTRYLRPDWTGIILIYWCISLPHRIGIGSAWIVGILIDALTGSLLGQHSLGFTFIAYASIQLHERMKLYPLWQQALTVFMLLTLNQLINLWVVGITGQAPRTWLYWLPSVTGMLIWPIIFFILRNLRRRFGIN